MRVRFLGKCVHTHGYLDRGVLFADVPAIYAKPFMFPITGTGGAGLYGDDKLLFAGGQYAELIGQLSTCGQYNRHEDELTKSGGFLITDDSFCGYATRPLPILYVSEWNAIQGRTLRLSGDEAARKYGNLMEINKGWRYAAEVNRLGERWFNAIQNRDASLGSDDRANELLDPESSPVRFLLGDSRPISIKYFRRELAPTDQRDFRYIAFGCVCKADDCAGQWVLCRYRHKTHNAEPRVMPRRSGFARKVRPDRRFHAA